jgi:hypothetical protein
LDLRIDTLRNKGRCRAPLAGTGACYNRRTNGQPFRVFHVTLFEENQLIEAVVCCLECMKDMFAFHLGGTAVDTLMRSAMQTNHPEAASYVTFKREGHDEPACILVPCQVSNANLLSFIRTGLQDEGTKRIRM